MRFPQGLALPCILICSEYTCLPHAGLVSIAMPYRPSSCTAETRTRRWPWRPGALRLCADRRSSWPARDALCSSFKLDNNNNRLSRPMKFTIQTILSMPADGASSHLLIIDKSVKILLDCGIARSFDLKKYYDNREDLKGVCLVLVSHSQMEYSGALPFLIDQLGLDPKIFYTTQSIMRYSPLNLHEVLLGLRSRLYTKEVFNRMYKIYESINIIKPQQKKFIDLSPSQALPAQALPSTAAQPFTSMDTEQEAAVIGEVSKTVYFTSYISGGNMGSIAWRLSYGIVNILYLVSYNNYSLYHIDGLDLPQVVLPTDILITDTYRNIDEATMKKGHLYQKLRDLVTRFYEKNGISLMKPAMMSSNTEPEKRMLISCYPNEILVEVMAVMKKVIEDLQGHHPPESRERIRVVHLSSRFLQLVKSQMGNFSEPFREALESYETYYSYSKRIDGRINLTTFQSLDGLLLDSIDKNVQVFHIGDPITRQQVEKSRQKGQRNIVDLKIFTVQQKLPHSSSKLEIEEEPEEEPSQKDQISQYTDEKERKESEFGEQIEMVAGTERTSPQPFHSKYFSLIGFFPRFASRPSEEECIFDDFGVRHQYARFQNSRTIQDCKKQGLDLNAPEPALLKKNSTIEVMNIEFKIPPLESSVKRQVVPITYIPFYSYKTNFNSSVQLINTIKPDNVILINTESTSRDPESTTDKYKTFFRSAHVQNEKKVTLYELAAKNYCHLVLPNELISYKVNYIPIPQERKLQKVKGLITYSEKGVLYIHLDCLEEKEHLEFRLDKFYKKVKGMEAHSCTFTRQGIVIDGVKIYRDQSRIVLEGQYSEEYFKVRRLLYDFLKME